jgi:hypothetical protein
MDRLLGHFFDFEAIFFWEYPIDGEQLVDDPVIH